MSATGSPRTVRVTRSPACTASITRLVSLRRSRTPISMCDSVAPPPSPERPLSAGAELLLLEYEPVVIKQLPFEADLVGADAGGERESEICAGQPTWDERELEQALPPAGRSDARIPL